MVVKVFVLLKRKRGLTMSAFIDHYESVHLPLVEKLSTRALRYERHYLHPIQNLIEDGPSAEPEYDVISEIWYEDLAAFAAEQQDARDRPDLVAAVIADEKGLFDRTKTRFTLVEDRGGTLATD